MARAKYEASIIQHSMSHEPITSSYDRVSYTQGIAGQYELLYVLKCATQYRKVSNANAKKGSNAPSETSRQHNSHTRRYAAFKSRRWRTLTTSGSVVRFGLCSQIGSTSGPSRSPAPSQPQHHTGKFQ